MRTTLKFLEQRKACFPAIEWFKKNNTGNAIEMINLAMDQSRFLWIIWVFVELMNKKQCIQFGIFGVELLFSIFENKYPDDIRPRKAIEAAKAYLVRPSRRTKGNALFASRAASAACDDYYDMGYGKTEVALAAHYVASAAAALYSDGIYSAIDVLDDMLNNFSNENEKIIAQRKIIDKGIELLEIK